MRVRNSPPPTTTRDRRLFIGPEMTYPGAEYSDEERLFFIAIERYKRERRRPYPTWREVLHVVHGLGYRKVGS
jgi:hypothetical protein